MASASDAPNPLARTADPWALSLGIFEHSPVAYAVFARSGHFLLANPAFRALFGSEPAPEYSLFDDEITAREGLAPYVRRAFTGETVHTPTFWYDAGELEHVHVADSRRVAISCTCFPLRSANGELAEVAIAYKDETREQSALQRAEAGEREAKKLADEAVAQAALYEAIIRDSGDGVIMSDPKGVMRVFNPAAVRQHGVSGLNVPSSEWTRMFGLCDLERRELPLQDVPMLRALNGERVEGARWLVQRPDGAWRTLTGTAAPLRGADGSRAGAVLITRDETERLLLEEQLRTALDELREEGEQLARTEGEFRAMFELAGVGMAQMEPATGRFLRVNQRLCELLGYTTAELLGLTLAELTHESERAEDFAAFQRMVRGESPVYRTAKRYSCKDGGVLWMEVTATVTRDASGQPLRAMAVLVDESERRRVEDRAKAISDNATVGLCMLDQRQHCVFMNPAAEQITGFTQREVQGKPLHWFVHHTRPDGTPYPIEECPIDRAFPEERQTQGEDVFVHKDGSFYPVAFTASPMHDASGFTRGTVIEVRETTKEKLAQAERDHLLTELEQAVRVRDEFLSIAGHEIRTPLTALLLNLQGLAAATDAANVDVVKLGVRVQRAKENAERLQRLVEELLDVSRIVSSRLSLEPEYLELGQLVREVAQRVRDQAAKLGGTLRVRCDAPLYGRWDRFRIEQVVSNLLTNALKYGAGHPVELTLREEHGVAVLSVCDQGIGIASEDHARIFERFERAVSSRHYGGLGLGLWIARQVVEASGGAIEVESQPKRGSRFTVRLPLYASDDARGESLES